jgi:ABC-type bacteriocin/lantibiotic exporter with double-glycine peptidase domain
MIDDLTYVIESYVGDNGVKLSGGQKQRLGLARALYISPKIIILDEATSALDIENEEKILKLIGGIKNKISIIIISHRESIFPYCDQILNLDQAK